MRPLNEILQSLKANYGYTEQEIDVLSRELDQISKVSYMAFKKEKRLSQKSQYGKSNIYKPNR